MITLNGANVLTAHPTGRFDGHAHVFGLSAPLAENRRYTPDHEATLADYLALLKAHGLNGSILVQPSFLGTNNSFMLNCISECRGTDMTMLGVAVLEPDAKADKIASLKDAGVVGIRFNLAGEGMADKFDLASWKPLLKLVNDAGWHVELHAFGTDVARLLPMLLDHADRVVVDHFGRPDAAMPLDCPGQKAILDAERGRVFVKASGPYRVFPKLPSNEAAERCIPLFKRFLAELGPDRLLWGSDWPWTLFEGRHDYAATTAWERLWIEAAS